MIYVIFSHELDEKRLRDTLIRGTCPELSIKPSSFVHCPSVERDFVGMVTPQEDPLSYFVVVGEHGTGKSTIMKAACSNVGAGVIYVDVPENVRKFGLVDAFAHAIGFKFHTSNNFSEYIHRLVHLQHVGSPGD
jgi:predicted NACHT family NTPase